MVEASVWKHLSPWHGSAVRADEDRKKSSKLGIGFETIKKEKKPKNKTKSMKGVVRLPRHIVCPVAHPCFPIRPMTPRLPLCGIFFLFLLLKLYTSTSSSHILSIQFHIFIWHTDARAAHPLQLNYQFALLYYVILPTWCPNRCLFSIIALYFNSFYRL